MVESVDIINNNFKRYLGLTILLNITFVFYLYFSGFFNIGLLSDSYEDLYNALNHPFTDFFSDRIYAGRFRPLLFIFLNFITYLNTFFQLEYNNFFIFNLVNLLLYLTYGITGSYLVFKIKQNYKWAIISNIVLIIFPNNIINLCWTASFFEILGMVIIFSHLLLILIIKNNKRIGLSILTILLFLSSLFLKEIFIIIPFISICFSIIVFGKIHKNIKIIFIFEIFLFFAYYLYRLLYISGLKYTDHNINDILRLMTKIFISLFLPGDYLTTYNSLLSFDFAVVAYIVTIVALSIFILMSSGINYRKILGLLTILTISVSPYFYAGYIRPQLIFIPFSIFVISAILIFEKPVKRNLSILFLFLLLIFQFTYYSFLVIKGWENAYNISIKRINILINEDIDFRNTIIIGNVSRSEQYYMFDKISFIYNYWKYHSFNLIDSINNHLSISTLNRNPEIAVINVIKYNDHYHLKINDDNSFINVSEFGETSKNRFNIEKVGEVEVISRNKYNKIIEIEFRPFDLNKNILIFDGKGVSLPIYNEIL